MWTLKATGDEEMVAVWGRLHKTELLWCVLPEDAFRSMFPNREAGYPSGWLTSQLPMEVELHPPQCDICGGINGEHESYCGDTQC